VSTQLLVTLALAVGAPALKPGPTAPAAPTLVGEWAVASWVADGQPEPCAGRTLTFVAGGAFVAHQDGEHQGAGTYTCDPKKGPAEVDMAEDGLDGPRKGIWKLDGDTLTLCVCGDLKGGRPPAFAAPQGSDCVLLTLKRVNRKD
jgi:uncharacterized protein (TIGR03067 family)